MCGVLPENIKLSLEAVRVEGAILAHRPITIVRFEYDERLEDGRFLAASSRTEDGAISRDFSPAKHSHPKVMSDFCEDGLLVLKLSKIVRSEEDVTDGIFSRLWKLATEINM